MSRKTPPQPPTPDPYLRVNQAEAALKIGERIALGEALFALQVTNVEALDVAQNEYSRWNAYNAEMLKRLFTTHRFADEYSYWGVLSIGGGPRSTAEQLKNHKENIRNKIHRLESVRDRLDLIPIAADLHKMPVECLSPERTNKVFIVHGHDEAARESVARFLDQLGLEPVVLHEQPTGGRTIVEKLEHYADVDFAVVVLTPDDVGRAKTSSVETLQSRARQNVILELGFFVGKLGRDRVCALHKGPLELPSDYLGVIYVALDDGGGWRLPFAKELRSAGFSVDMNRAL